MNQGWAYTDRIRAVDSSQPALAYYLCHYGHSDEAAWQARFDNGEITRDDRTVRASDRLTSGDVLTWRRPPWQEPEVPCLFTLIYEDDDILAVDKPAGLPVLPGGGYVENTLLHLLRLRTPGNPPVPVHRLGRGTSGLVLFARSPHARQSLAAAFRDTTCHATAAIRKIYRAVTGPVSGLPDECEITQPIGPVPHPLLGSVHAASPGGKPAHSRCRILRRGADSTLWEIDLITGRPHQIRIHLAAIGAPLQGDPLYGPGGTPLVSGPGCPAVPGDCGYLLHACSLAFQHPRTNTPLVLTAPPPAALRL